VYTNDSDLAAAAVHAGVLRDGERGLITITVMAGNESYSASSRNGVSSQSYGPWGGGFRVARADSDRPTILRTGPVNPVSRNAIQ